MNTNTPTFRTQGEKEYYEKYESLFQLKPHVVRLIPFTSDEVKEALAGGDEHLNTLPLRRWDMMAPSVGWTSENGGIKYKSLAEQVCLLKHAAKYHYIN